MTYRKIAATLMALMVFSWMHASAAKAETIAYMRLEVQGSMIEGTVTTAGHEGWILVASFGHSITVPTDIHSGAPTGSRTHGPIRIVKPVDKASPLIYQALCMGKQVTLAEIHFLRPNAEQGMELFFEIELQNGLITSVSPSFIPTAAAQNQMLETVSITYESISWKDVASSIEYMDQWRDPIR